MPKVSTNTLPRQVQDEITNEFIRALAGIREPALLRRFLHDLLTPSERIMLAKRFMIAILLQRAHRVSDICRMLKVSKSTVNIVHRELQKSGDGYREVFNKFFKSAEAMKFVEVMSRVLLAAHLPVKGSPRSMRRWKHAMFNL